MNFEKAKPIEPNCLAMIINTPPHKTDWEGRIVLVLERAESTHVSACGVANGCPGWVVDIPTNKCLRGFYAIEDKHLLRIDDEDPIETEIEQEIEA